MTPEEYLNRARALIPAIRERAPYTEQLRRLPDETFKEFQEAGLFRAIQPTHEDAPPDVRSFLVPRSDYIIDDNWHVMGLCGTGSKDIVVEKAFVPEYRTLSYLDTFYLRHPGTAVNDGPLFRLPFGIIFPYALVAPAIGVALGALQHFREQARARVFRDGARVVEDPFVQFRLADAAAEVDAA